ncbi:MAG TPA: hypothetical protein VFU14_12770 [Acidimicrobiales bacterium]|nr:hypothetical protein [Acidimicrobiales bacterium]
MLGLRTCPRGRLLVVLAVLAVAAIALVPRGLVRATAAAQLAERDRVSAPEPGIAGTPEADPDLPGVRALIAREEQDAAHLVIRLVTSSPAGDVAAAVDGAPTWRLPDAEPPAPTCDETPVTCGPRAPPRSI